MSDDGEPGDHNGDLTGAELLAVLRRLPPADQPETIDESAARVAEGLAAAAAARRLREREARKMKLDHSINLPTILTIIGMALGGLAYVNNLERRIAASEQAIVQNEERARETRQQTAQQALKNELQDSQNRVQEERIQNLAISAGDLRRTIAEQTSVLGSMREDLATIRVKLSIEKPPSRDR